MYVPVCCVCVVVCVSSLLDNSNTLHTLMHTAVGDDCRGMPGDAVWRGLCFMEHTVLSCTAAVKVL